jgi:hypothetical protein
MVHHLDNINVMWILYICSPILYMFCPFPVHGDYLNIEQQKGGWLMVQHLDNINVIWILYICSPILYICCPFPVHCDYLSAKQQKVAD